MNFKKIFGLAFLLLFSFLMGSAQEYMLATNVHLNNRGYGIGFNLHQESEKKVNNNFEFLLTGLKDLKELRISNVALSNPAIDPGSFVYGKINKIFSLRLGYGKEINLAKRPDKNSVGVILSSTGGINLGLQTPIYIDYDTPGKNEYGFETVRYNPEIHERSSIYQSHYFTNGLQGLKLRPSFYLKQGLILEFGNYVNTPNRLETGVIFDAFPVSPEIMYNKQQPNLILSFYISFAVLNINL